MQLNYQGIYHFQSSLFSERVQKVDSVIEYNLSFPLSPDIIANCSMKVQPNTWPNTLAHRIIECIE